MFCLNILPQICSYHFWFLTHKCNSVPFSCLWDEIADTKVIVFNRLGSPTPQPHPPHPSRVPPVKRGYFQHWVETYNHKWQQDNTIAKGEAGIVISRCIWSKFLIYKFMNERQRGSDEKKVKIEKQKVSGNGRRDQVAKKRCPGKLFNHLTSRV